MKDKINIAELLKDCQSGMELDCTMYDNVELEFVANVKEDTYPIKLKTKHGTPISVTEYGCYDMCADAKCIIFPKGKTTWEGFQRPFKDGDIVVGKNQACSYITIFKDFRDNTLFNNYVCLTSFGTFKVNDFSDNANLRFATEEEKQKLFQVIKENGYKWNAETKTLEKLPKFKVGDKVMRKATREVHIIERITSTGYLFKNEGGVGFIFEDENLYKLDPNKFDINTLKPFDKVLVRTKNFTPTWTIDFYDGYKPNIGGNFTPFGVTGGKYFQQCIPYKGNEHLRGTTNDCDEYFKTWK